MKYKLIIILLIGISTTLQAQNLRIMPDFVSLKWGETVEFQITGQTGVVHWVSVKGEMNAVRKGFMPGVTMETGQIQLLQSDKIKYTAPYQAGTYTIAATDEHEMVVAQIQVHDLNDAVVMVEILTDKDRQLVVDDQTALSLRAWLPDKTQRDYTETTTWESSDAEILTVNESGVVTALTPGTASISASLWGQTDQIQFTVEPKTPIGLIISPSPVYLTTEDTQSLTFEWLLKNTDERQLATDCHVQSKNTDWLIITANSELKPLKPGHTIVEAECAGLKASVPIFISLPFPLAVTPDSFILDREESQVFRIMGGMPPYTVSAKMGKVKGNGEHWYYEAARMIGDDTINIIDQAGAVTTLDVTVTSGLILSPLAIDLSANTSGKFVALGGLPPYRWQVSAGILSANEGAEVIYTAPPLQGNYVITVMDAQGRVETAVINVGMGLIATPNQLILAPKEEKRFLVTGGTPDYIISTNVGHYTKEEESYYYVAPAVSGHYSIVIRDAEDRHATIEVIVKSSLQVTPTELFLLRNEEAQLYIKGGYGDYCVFTEMGESVDGRYCMTDSNVFTYKAADTAGHDTIAITDQAGTVIQVEVSVSREGFYVSPEKSYLLANSKTNLRALGGTAPYNWRVLGEGDLSKTQGDQVIFTAPQVAGEYKVLLTDNVGKEVESTVVVYLGKLAVAPEILVLAPGKSERLHALSGVPIYKWWAQQSNNLSATEGEEVIYTAPLESSEDVIWVRDATGSVQSLPVVISNEKIKNISQLYAGNNGKLDDNETNRAIDEYFQQKGWLNRYELFFLIEQFYNDNK